MYDPEDNLLGVFAWDRIEGFQVVGSAVDQVIVEGELPHEKKQKISEQIALKRKKGEFISEIEMAHDALTGCSRQLSRSWLTINELASKRKTEINLLIGRCRGEVQRLEAMLIDDQAELAGALKRILDEIAQVLKEEKE
jgi:hypothetical protein